jgi:PAS domain S-box-containing protein
MSKPVRVLIVEDSEDDAALLLRTLRRGSYTPIYERVDTEEGMRAALRQSTWDVVVSDYSMPTFSAPAALAVLKESGIDIPFLIVSGTVGEETAVAALKAGAHDFMLKGDMPRLIPAMERELREAELRRAGQQAESALRESEIRYRRMFEDTRALQMIVDPHSWNILDANPAACEFYGYSHDALITMKLTQISVTPHLTMFEQMAQALSGQRTSFTFRHEIGSGEIRDVEIFPNPLEISGQTVLYCIIHDITERKQAENELAALYNATSFLLKADSLSSLAHQIVQIVIQEFDQVDCGLMLVDSTGKEMVRVARAGEYRVSTNTSLFVDGQGLVPEAIRTGKTIYAPDVTQNPNYAPNDPRTRSEMVIPLKTSKRILGVLDLQSTEINAISQRNERILVAFAERAAAAIEIMQLYEEINQHAVVLEKRVLERTSELHRTKDHVEAILNNTSDAIILASFDGIIRQVNPAFSLLLGYAGDEVFGHSLFTFVALQDVETMLEALRSVVIDKLPKRIEISVRRKDDSAFDADIALAPITEQGNIRDIVCSLRDMTERKMMEVSMRESEARYRRLAENAQDIIYRYRVFPTRGFEYVSPASILVLGYTPEEHYVNPNLILDRTHPDDKPILVSLFQSDDPPKEPLILRWRRRDGSEIWIEQRNAFVYDDNGRLIAIEGISRDISERKRIEEELRGALEKEKELNELKTRFVSMVSHDFRTPLAVIQTSTDTLQRYDAQLDEKQKSKRFEKIKSQIQRMVALLNDVLTISRADAGAMPFMPATLNLDLFCREIIEEFVNTPDMKHSLIYACTNEKLEADVDEKLLHQAVVNLLTNAFKYSPEGSKVFFNLQFEGSTALLSVRDSGIGIPEADQKRLFETFHRAANVGSIEGTGLGLAIVKRAVEIHGGTVTFESVMDKGTTFTIHIPVRQQM